MLFALFFNFWLILTMSEFSLEENGYFISDVQEISSDPFSVLDKKNVKEPAILVDQYSDISDDDFYIPSSQKRLPK